MASDGAVVTQDGRLLLTLEPATAKDVVEIGQRRTINDVDDDERRCTSDGKSAGRMLSRDRGRLGPSHADISTLSP